ncbi:MAG TPA: hypothetical protein VIQ27_13625 [Gemmatimonadales bacterium]
MTHTERVHVLFGAGLILMALLAIAADRRPGGIASAAWAGLAFVIGLLLFVPVEANTRTYTLLGWMDVLRTVVPDHPAHWVGDWFVKARATHVLQHKIAGVAAMLAASVELVRARGALSHPRWRYVLPACLLTVAASLGLHGGTSHHLPFAMEQREHHVMGTGFALGGLSLGLHRAGILPHRRWALVWPVLALLAGIGLVLFYRLPPGAAGHPTHSALPAHPALSRGTR